MSKPFDAVELPDEYPRQTVADHEALMAFNSDSDALLFREWWSVKGSRQFAEWIEK